MSDTGAPAGDQAPDADPVVDGDIDTGEQAEDAAPEQPPRQYVEVDDPDNRFVRIRIDGQDVEVPYNEALKGYSRTEDYTRKTQEVSAMRQQAEMGLRLQEALAANPRLTLQLLNEQFDPKQPEAPAPPEFDDPLEQKLHEERQARLALEERITAREADQQLERAIGGLRTEFGASEEDVRSVINVAMQQNLGIEALPMIYKTMAYDRIAATMRAHAAQQTQEREETQRRQGAAQQAGRLVTDSTGGNGRDLTNTRDPGGRMSLREAIEAAMEQPSR